MSPRERASGLATVARAPRDGLRLDNEDDGRS